LAERRRLTKACDPPDATVRAFARVTSSRATRSFCLSVSPLVGLWRPVQMACSSFRLQQGVLCQHHRADPSRRCGSTRRPRIGTRWIPPSSGKGVSRRHSNALRVTDRRAPRRSVEGPPRPTAPRLPPAGRSPRRHRPQRQRRRTLPQAGNVPRARRRNRTSASRRPPEIALRRSRRLLRVDDGSRVDLRGGRKGCGWSTPERSVATVASMRGLRAGATSVASEVRRLRMGGPSG
jgi:hypothetical protein